MPGFPVSQPSFLELKTPTPMFFYLNFGKSLEQFFVPSSWRYVLAV